MTTIFMNNNGVVEMKGVYPHRLVPTSALRKQRQLWGFVLDERLAGRDIISHGGSKISPLCNAFGTCKSGCPIAYKVCRAGCQGTPIEICRDNPHSDGNYQIPLIRDVVHFLEEIEYPNY